ncbi:MAG: WD40 repeat domain-containing protein [Pseudomonadota bacterium]|uniref:WD40 repeat domain-containing protein n=1 Tax=Burkholderiaceae TaxID=119060 RepID=UPI0010FA2DED|nr:WD40 repeat domain-containing protein [Burkholderia sp. 4M9327F10]
MKLRKAAVASVIFMGVAGMTTDADAQSGNSVVSNVASASVTTPKLQRTIKLGGLLSESIEIMKISFSPNGRYLGIVGSGHSSPTIIVVWDMQRDREQSRIHCQYDYSTTEEDHLLWSSDGKTLSFGPKMQWDAMTGDTLPERPAVGFSARLNKDGSKLLTLVGTLGDPSDIYVYDTKTWALQIIHADGLRVTTASWTTDDRILVSAMPTSETGEGKTLDGHLIHWYDTAIRLVDPSGKEKTKAVWFPQEPTNDPKSPYTYAFPVGTEGQTNFATNEIFLASGQIINGATLSVRHYHSFNATDIAPGGSGMGFSPDGKFLYLKGSTFADPGRKPIENSIVDIASGKPLLQFSGAMGDGEGLAVSPDGQYLALANKSSVLLFNLR